MQYSPLNEIIKSDVQEATEYLLKSTVEPWIFFNTHGISIRKVDGSMISISGVEFSDSTREIFWEGFADGYINKKCRELIESTRSKAVLKNISIEESLRDCLVHIKVLVVTIFNKMADIDQRLRGGGRPESVAKKDVKLYVDRNLRAIRALVTAEIDCIHAVNKTEVESPMELHKQILTLAINKMLPDQLNENFELPIEIVSELIDEGYLKAIDGTTFDGTTYFQC